MYTACGAAAVLVIFFGLDHVQASEDNQTSNTKELVSATVRLMLQKKLILLIPITMVSGLEQAYMQGDFTKVIGAFFGHVSFSCILWTSEQTE